MIVLLITALVLDYSVDEFKMLNNICRRKDSTPLPSYEDIFQTFINASLNPLRSHLTEIFACDIDSQLRTNNITDMWKFIEVSFKTIELKLKVSISNNMLSVDAAHKFLQDSSLKPGHKLDLREINKPSKQQDLGKFI
jgi:hypothetical protein